MSDNFHDLMGDLVEELESFIVVMRHSLKPKPAIELPICSPEEASTTVETPSSPENETALTAVAPPEHDNSSVSTLSTMVRDFSMHKSRLFALECLCLRTMTAGGYSPEAVHAQVLELLQQSTEAEKGRLSQYYNDSARTAIAVESLGLTHLSAAFPDFLKIDGVQKQGQYPIAATHSADIWKGRFGDSSVCLKVVRGTRAAAQFDKYLKSFSREGLLWKRLSHPNLLPFYGVSPLDDIPNGRVALVSPWMEHGNINEYLISYPDANRPRLIMDVIEGLSYLHSNNIIHRDLKGANILILPSGKACISDFGLSSITFAAGESDGDSSSATSSSSVVSTAIEKAVYLPSRRRHQWALDLAPSGGTIRWQAPESIDFEGDGDHRRSITTAVDIYAFGFVCYEVFTDQIPFSEIYSDMAVVLTVLAGGRPDRPEGQVYVRYGLDDAMWGLMEQCWAQDPLARPGVDEIRKRLVGL